MDKKLLDALNNIGDALDMLVDALKNKQEAKSATGAAIQGGDFGKNIIEIKESLNLIKDDTKKILDNQKTIMGIAKEQKSSSGTDKSKDEIANIGGDKNKANAFKDGLAIIGLLAIAVLALGFAFKIIGDIPIGSVLALSFAIAILGGTFVLVQSQLKKIGFKPIDGLMFIIAVTSISAGIMISSFLLSMVTPISLAQFFTTLFIAGTFVIVAHGISKMMEAFDGKTPKEIALTAIALPIILPAIALGIALSSWVLSMVTPISLAQFFTSIFIAGTFVIVAHGISKLMDAFTGKSPKEIAVTAIALPIILPAIALGIAASSWALSMVTPISLAQFFTSLFIAAAFTVIAFGLSKLLSAFDGKSPKEIAIASLALPIILPAIALGIAASSWVLSMVTPISLAQFFTSLFIAGIFALTAYGISKMINAFGDMDEDQIIAAAITLPFIMPAIALGIAASSWALSMVTPISLAQFFTSLFIAGIFTIISYGVSKIVGEVGKMKWTDLLKVPVFFTLISLAIAVSSFIIAESKILPWPTLLQFLALGTILAALTFAMIPAIKALSKIPPSAILKGGAMILGIALTIALSSLILSIGNYGTYPDWKWALGVGLTILAFSPAIIALGIVAMTGIGAVAVIAGAGMLLLIASSIVAVSNILSDGNYSNYPPLDWTLGTLAILMPMSATIAALGLLSLAILLGIPMITKVAESIVDVSNILANGNYSVDGLLGWAVSTVLLFTTFTPIFLALAGMGIVGALLSMFGAKDPFESAGEMLCGIARTIVDVSYILADGKYEGGPKKEWAEGISIAMGAFAPIYGMMILNKILGGSLGPKEFGESISTVISGIVIAAEELSKAPDKWNSGPKKEWAEGVGTAIGAFAPVYDMMLKSAVLNKIGVGGVGVSEFVESIKVVSMGIIAAANIFASDENTGVWKLGPTKEWGEGIGASINAFLPVFNYVSDNSGWFKGKAADAILDLQNAILSVSGTILTVGMLFNIAKIDWASLGGPKKEWANGIGDTIKVYMGIMKDLEKNDMDIEDFNKNSNIITSLIGKIVGVAKKISMSENIFSSKIDASFVDNLRPLLFSYIDLSKEVESSMGSKSSQLISGLIGSVSGGDPIIRVVSNISNIGNILSKGNFSQTIDPGFMKKLSPNILGYVALANYIKKVTGSGLMSGLKGTQDPITKVAIGMSMLAKSYDKLSKSIKGFGSAINEIDEAKINLFRSLTGNLAIISTLDQEMFNNMLDTLEQRSSVFVDLLKDFQKEEKETKPEVKTAGASGVVGKGEKKNSADITNEKLDSVIAVLNNIFNAVDPLDDYLNNIDKKPLARPNS
jgi:hypothetical protein